MIKKENGMYTHVEETLHQKEIGAEKIIEVIDQNTLRLDLEALTHHYTQVADSLACGMNRGTQFPREDIRLLNDMCDRIITLSTLAGKVLEE